MIIIPTTKLEAVNVLLTSIGEAPVNSLGDDLDEAALAEKVLDEVSRAVQKVGWHWNTEDNFPLMRNVDGNILLPVNTLKADFQTTRYVTRGNKVYDKHNHTYTFSNDITATMTFGFDWSELPESLRGYIMYRGGRTFQARQVGSRVLHEFTKGDEEQALVELKIAELEVSNVSIFQNAELALMLNRSSSTPVIDYPAGSFGGTIYD